MSLADLKPTVEHLRALALDEMLEDAQWRSCSSYAPIVKRAAAEAREAKDENRCALGLLAFVLGLRFDADRDSGPFKAHGWFNQYGPDDLSAEQYEVLEAWLPDIADVEIAARIADLLWITRRGKEPAHLHGRTAVKKYVAAAQRFAADRKHWPLTRDRVRRALTLAVKFQIRDEVEGFVLQVLRDRGGAAPGYFDSGLMEVLLDFGAGDPDEWMPVACSLAEAAEVALRAGAWGRPGPGLAKHFWEVTARWRIAKVGDHDDNDARKLKVRAAEMSIVEADHARDANQPMAEAHFLGEALRDLRKIGASERVQEILGRIRDAHQRAPTVKVSSDPIDLSAEADKARHAVAGKSFKDAMAGLAFVVQPPSKVALKEIALDYLRNSVAERIAAAIIMSEDARVIAHKPSMQGNGPDAPDEPDEVKDAALIEWQMRASAPWLRGTACAYIGGAWQQLMLEHHVRLRDLMPLVAQSYLVPEGHEGLFARGFLAGFDGDFATACHILVPQLENGLRGFVERALGKVLIRHKDDGTQMAGLLGRVLAVPELEPILGQDIIFDLRGLLIEQDSVNLRNNLAHGLIPDRGFGTDATYFWWLCLRIAFLMIHPGQVSPVPPVDAYPAD